MSDITMILVTIAIALLFFVIIINFVFPKKKNQKQQKEDGTVSSAELVEKKQAEFFTGKFDKEPQERLPELEARILALSNKVLLAHERLQKIEALIQNPANPKGRMLLQVPSEELQSLNKRVEKLMDFKSNAEIELAAMKDALREKGILKQPKNNNIEKKTIEAEKEITAAEKKLHDLVFKASSGK